MNDVDCIFKVSANLKNLPTEQEDSRCTVIPFRTETNIFLSKMIFYTYL